MNLIDVWESIQKTGGATFQLSIGVLNPLVGYCVAIKGTEEVYPDPVTIVDFQDYLKHYMMVHDMAEVLDNYRYLGFWKKDKRLIIDTVYIETDLGKAVHEGIANEQMSIYDLNRQKTIDLLPVNLSQDEWYIIDKKKMKYVKRHNRKFVFMNEYGQTTIYTYSELRTREVLPYTAFDLLILNCK